MKTFVLFLVSVVTAAAEGLAPDSIANVVCTMNVTVATGGAATGRSSGVFSAMGIDYRLNADGFPMSAPIPYTYTKVGPNSATITETDGTRTVVAELTFTESYRGTFRLTSPQTTALQSGTFWMSRIPQPPMVAPLINIATRAQLVAGGLLMPGFVVGGQVPRRVLIRAVGPTLAVFGVAAPLATPTLAVFSGQTQIAANSGWAGDPALAATFSAVGAFALPVNSRDAALVLTLNPGNYTAQVGGGAGEVLLEVYFVE